MKRILGFASICVFATAAVAGFMTKSEREVELADAEALADLLADQIQRSAPPARRSGEGRSGAGRAKRLSIAVEVPAEDFPASQLHAAMSAAIKKWGEFETFPTRGGPGQSMRNEPGLSAHRSSLHFGTNDSHAFVDAVAYPFGEETRIEILVRVLE